MLSPEEIERYARHIVLHGVGGPGQLKLKSARVLIIGAGGLGAPLIQYLAAAGIGEIGIADYDEVSLSNLQRQIIFGTEDVGRAKVDCAQEAVRRLNPFVNVAPLNLRISEANARNVVKGFDIIADGSDNFGTRYAVSDACFFEKKPLVTAAVGAFDGTLTVLRPYERSASGEPNPTYRCLYPEPPPPEAVPACSATGVLGALTGLIGAMMALEVLREIVGFGDGLIGKLMLIDALNLRFETIRYGWDPANPLSGKVTGPSSGVMTSGMSKRVVPQA